MADPTTESSARQLLRVGWDQDWDLARIVARWPWDARWRGQGVALEQHWSWDLQVGRDALWRKVSDTSETNRRLGLAPMTLVERDGQVHGEQAAGLSTLSWVESPWEWEAPFFMRYDRVYDRGPVKVVRTVTVLQALGPSKTRVHGYVGAVVGNALMKWLVGRALRSTQTRYANVLTQYEAELLWRDSAPPRGPAMPAVPQRLDALTRELIEGGCPSAHIEKIASYLRSADENELHRIRPLSLARRWSFPDEEFLGSLLHATRAGMLNLTWELTCPHCRGVRQTLDHLGELPKNGSCEACDLEFEAGDPGAIEVTFRAHPSIRKTQARLWCAAEPATKQHILAQRVVAPKEVLELRVTAPPAQKDSAQSDGGARDREAEQAPAISEFVPPNADFRIRAKGSTAELMIAIDAAAPARVEATWPPRDKTLLKLAPDGQVALRSEADGAVTIVLESVSPDQLALRPRRLFGLSDFRDLFAEESLNVDVQLDVGVQALLFTDVVGSTRMYLEQGDAAAFAAVRAHFILAHEIVERHRGVVVKTIGDAVMAAFEDPTDSVMAAIEIQRVFGPDHAKSPLRLRISLHAGPCLAVNLNRGIDYFGTTVNLAAKLQAGAEAGEVAVSRELWRDASLRARVLEEGVKVEEAEIELKANGEKLPFARLLVS